MSRTLYEYVLLFFLFSTVGWLWESIVCSLYKCGHLINRGFLNGPYCPIYGCGALCGILCLNRIESPLPLFLCAGFSCCMLEYMTSYVMEKLFHARWWDYSDMPFNLNGRVYLNGFIAFGGASVVLIKWLSPFVVSAMEQISFQGLSITAFVLTVLFIIDNIITISGFIHFDEKLKEINLAIELAEKRQQWQSARQSVKLVIYTYIGRLTLQELRILSAFPRLRSVCYNHVLMELRAALAMRSSRKTNTLDNECTAPLLTQEHSA